MARARRPHGGRASQQRAARDPRTPPKLLQSARAAPTAGARTRRPLWRRGERLTRPSKPAALARSGGAATALGPAANRQTTRIRRGRPGREARAATQQQRQHSAAPTAAHVATRLTYCSMCVASMQRAMVAFSPVGDCLGLTAGTSEPSESISASRCFANSSVRRSPGSRAPLRLHR